MKLRKIIQVIDLKKSNKRLLFIILKKKRNNPKIVYLPSWMSEIAKNSLSKIIFLEQFIRLLLKIKKIIPLFSIRPTCIQLKSKNIFFKLTDNLYKNWLLKSNLLNLANLIITKYLINNEQKHQNYQKKIRILKYQFLQDSFKNH